MNCETNILKRSNTAKVGNILGEILQCPNLTSFPKKMGTRGHSSGGGGGDTKL